MSTLRSVLCAAIVAFPFLAMAQFGTGAANSGIQWRTYQEGMTSLMGQASTRVLQTQGDFERYWHELNGPSSIAPRDLEWSKELLIAVNIGNRTTAGYGVFIQGIEKVSPSEAKVTWIERTPESDQGGLIATSPWQIVRVQRSGLRYSFEQGKYYPGLDGIHIYNLGSNCSDGALWQPYDSGVSCNVTRPFTVVITDQGTFTTYCQQLFSSSELGSSDFQTPENVDWSQQELVAIHLGQRPTTGYGIQIVGIKRVSEFQAEVEYAETTPQPGFMQAQHITSPFIVVRIPRNTLKFEFKKVPLPKPTVIGG